ncbi:MAG: succinylglutamate desuccinylase/aspartoacylase family protein [Flavobacteriaceae bacterium]|nr:succinylglutamate desuccinylase/aspartoacylase family protein [Flavobacteriaceae bacterium]
MRILNTTISPGSSHLLKWYIANLYTSTPIEIPVVVERAKADGPCVLITAGIHGDEVCGIEIVRSLIANKINKPLRGTVICVPIVNILGFLKLSREFPDGRDLNRVFPGSSKGSLASRYAYDFTQKILPVADICIDFHTGGAMRFNAPQIRISKQDKLSASLAKAFNAPFTVYSSTLSKSYRAHCAKLGMPSLLFEGGKSQDIDDEVVKDGVDGAVRVLEYLHMLSPEIKVTPSPENSIVIDKTTWVRANVSGLFHPKVACGQWVKARQLLGRVSCPYGGYKKSITAAQSGYIINVNHAPVVYQGDAVFHISKE